jgi:hypothetical protein
VTAWPFSYFSAETVEPVEHGPFASPGLFGRRMRRKFRRNLPADLRVIDANKDTMTVDELAEAMGISPARVKSLAASASPPINLRVKKEPEPRGA